MSNKMKPRNLQTQKNQQRKEPWDGKGGEKKSLTAILSKLNSSDYTQAQAGSLSFPIYSLHR